MRTIDSAERLYQDLDIAEKSADKCRKMYAEASNELLKKLKKAFPKHRVDTGISKAEAEYLLSNNDHNIDIINVESRLNGLIQGKLKPSTAMWLRDNQTKSRINRLNGLDLWVILFPLFEEVAYEMGLTLKEVERNQYYYAMFDIQRTLNKISAVGEVPSVIPTDDWGYWYNKLYRNTEKLNNMLRDELNEAVLMGRSLVDVADILEHRFFVSANEARRLIRTESTYAACQSQLNAYKKYGIEFYEYVAILDMRTSLMCRQMNGSIHRVNNAVVGVNLPPLHPWCRSTTIAYLPPEEVLNPFWAGEPFPNEMDYESWLEEVTSWS